MLFNTEITTESEFIRDLCDKPLPHHNVKIINYDAANRLIRINELMNREDTAWRNAVRPVMDKNAVKNLILRFFYFYHTLYICKESNRI